MPPFTTKTLDFNNKTDEEIRALLVEYKISLTISEIKKIQNDILKRPPSVAEAILWSIQGSEHCSYKSSRPFLKQFTTNGPNVLLGPSEDAGIVSIATDASGKRYGVVASHESHNHPSQIVPYEGAATGVGGNVRDVCCMGAKVVAIADSLRFGDIAKQKTRTIAEGVVAGIAGYGNPIGVPNLAGDVYFDAGYNENCLVNVVTLGVLAEDEIIHSKAPVDSAGYDLILVGKPTDNSGFGGASFASLELNEKEKEANKGAVQEPNAFLKRHLLKSTYLLFALLKQKNLLNQVGFKDLGAGGIACASVELVDSAGYGAHIDLDSVPVGMEHLDPAVILCAETQERFLWIAPPHITRIILEHYNKTCALPEVSVGACAAVIGTVEANGAYVVTHKGTEYVHANASDITKGLLYNRPHKKPEPNSTDIRIPEPENYNTTIRALLASEHCASREPIYEQYDKNVQGITVLERGNASAGVIQPFINGTFPTEIQQVGVALSVAHNPRQSKCNPYLGGVLAVLEAMRAVAAVGAMPYALTDCLNFGNPEKEDQFGEFTESIRGVADAAKAIHLKDNTNACVPIIAGNVSLYNESNGRAIPPSPIIACIGKVTNVQHATTMHFKQATSRIFLLGERTSLLGGSVLAQCKGILGGTFSAPEYGIAENQMFAVIDAIEQGVVLAAHAIGAGGAAIALSEMCFRNNIGCDVAIPGNLTPLALLFNEAGGFMLEISHAHTAAFSALCKQYSITAHNIGETIPEKRIRMNSVVDIDLQEAKKAWENGLREKL